MCDKKKKSEIELNIPFIISVNVLVTSLIIVCCILLAF